MAIQYLSVEKLFRARRMVAAKGGVNIEMIPDQDKEVLEAYSSIGGAFIGSLKELEVVEATEEKPKKPEKPRKKKDA